MGKDAAESDDGDGLADRTRCETGSGRERSFYVAHRVEHDMHVQTANPKSVYTSAARLSRRPGGPGNRLLWYEKRCPLPIDLGIQSLDIDGTGNHSFLKAQHGFQDAHKPGRLECMADIGLHTRNRKLFADRQNPGERLGQG